MDCFQLFLFDKGADFILETMSQLLLMNIPCLIKEGGDGGTEKKVV